MARAIHKGAKSYVEWAEQRTGIRQRCPLSPYSFVFVTTVMFADKHEQDRVKTKRQRAQGAEADN
eukprot:6138636-Lingulodinium_polyedra.AAC.1